MAKDPIRVGSSVEVVCDSGLGTGGTEIVTLITPTEIRCGAHRYDRRTGRALSAPWAYSIVDIETRGVVGPDDTSVPMFTADHARKLRDQALGDPVGATIGPILVFVHERIRRAAEEGRSEITHPFVRPDNTYPELPKDMEWPRHEVQEAVWRALTIEGFKVTHHPDPDPGHPGSGPYTSVSW